MTILINWIYSIK
ncbi:unnamed protein product [Gordionus sp. m RMFG-2023]